MSPMRQKTWTWVYSEDCAGCFRGPRAIHIYTHIFVYVKEELKPKVCSFSRLPPFTMEPGNAKAKPRSRIAGTNLLIRLGPMHKS